MTRHLLLGLGLGLAVVIAGCGKTSPKRSGAAADAGGAASPDVSGPEAPDTAASDNDVAAVADDAVASDVGVGGGDLGGGCDPACEAPAACIQGTCQKPQICQPGSWICQSLTSKKQCNEDGTAFLEATDCPGDQYCTSGQCGLKCSLDPKWGAYVGCVFWSVDLPVWDDPTLPNAMTLPHAVVISNPSELPATVAFEEPPGVTFGFVDLTIPPVSSKVFEFPSMDPSGSNIYDTGIRIESDRPVLVHQFNPWDNTYSNDASLLLPEPLLGQEHLVLSWPTDPRGLIEIPIPGLPQMDNVNGFLTVVAPFDGTEVTVRTTARVEGTILPEGSTAEPTVKPMVPGSIQTFKLNRGQVLNLDATPKDIFEVADLTGSLVLSNKPVAVFSGHDSASIAPPNATESCCLDHLEEEMIPVPLLGNHYIGAKAKSRGAGDMDLWRIVAAEDKVKLTTTPSIAGLDGVVLAKKGEWVEAYTAQSFDLQATGKVLVGQYLIAQQATADFIGDPSLILAIPVERFRSSYPIMAPDSYSKNYVTVVREQGVEVQLDGQPVADSAFKAVSSTTWEIAWLEISHGVHSVTSTKPFLLSAYGFDSAASYGYPGGMTIPGESNP